jgi:hypothetical protein
MTKAFFKFILYTFLELPSLNNTKMGYSIFRAKSFVNFNPVL